MKSFFVAIGVIGGLILAALFISMAAFSWGVFSENLAAKYSQTVLKPKITQTIYQADNAIAVYTKFRTECRSVVALNQQIVNLSSRYNVLANAAKTNDPFGQKAQNAADALNDLTGAKNLRAQTAEQYNADSANYTQADFKALSSDDPELPYRINPPYTNIDCG